MTGPGQVRARALIAICVVAALVVVPVVFSSYFTGAVASRALFLGLAAASLTFLAGDAGIVSLAQMGLYGVAGFLMARFIVISGMDPVLAALLGIVIAVLVGLMFGLIASGTEGIYLLMITLAFGVITYYFFAEVTAFGGHEGINNVAGPGFIGNPVQNPKPIYYLSLACSVGAYVLVRYLRRTPFGLVLQGLRDDPTRMRALGYNVRLHRTLGFAVGGFLAGLAGVLGTWHETRISPETINVSASVELLTMAVIGGLYRIEGAWIGALIYTLLDTYTRGITARFETWIGIILLAILILSPGGIAGLTETVWHRLRGGLPVTGRASPPPLGEQTAPPSATNPLEQREAVP